MFLETRGDAAELLEFAKEALDQITPPVEFRRDSALPSDAVLGREMRQTASRGDPLDQSEAVISAIRNHDAQGQRVQQDQAPQAFEDCISEKSTMVKAVVKFEGD